MTEQRFYKDHRAWKDCPFCGGIKWKKHRDSNTCLSCRAFVTSNKWGIASNTVFQNRNDAEFYKKFGRLPK